MSKPKPFDPSSKTDVMADEIRRKVASLGISIFNNADFRSLKTAEQIEVVTGGILTGLMGILHSFVIDAPLVHDELEAFVTFYVAQARVQAEGISKGGALQ